MVKTRIQELELATTTMKTNRQSPRKALRGRHFAEDDYSDKATACRIQQLRPNEHEINDVFAGIRDARSGVYDMWYVHNHHHMGYWYDRGWTEMWNSIPYDERPRKSYIGM